jgi:hypothetical protein
MGKQQGKLRIGKNKYPFYQPIRRHYSYATGDEICDILNGRNSIITEKSTKFAEKLLRDYFDFNGANLNVNKTLRKLRIGKNKYPFYQPIRRHYSYKVELMILSF